MTGLQLIISVKNMKNNVERLNEYHNYRFLCSMSLTQDFCLYMCSVYCILWAHIYVKMKISV